MRTRTSPCLAPADTGHGAADDGPVMENVSFRLAPGTKPDDFLSAARAIQSWLLTQPGFVSRRLTQGTDGTWTDLVEWRSLAQATAAGEAIMALPEAQPMMRSIDPASVALRHDRLVLHDPTLP